VEEAVVDNELVTALAVSGIGMLVLFLALTFLYVLMFLMTAFIKDPPKVTTEAQRCQDTTGQIGRLRRAAVIAVALARYEHELRADGTPRVTQTASVWQMLHRHRQLMLNLRTRRVR
jgi:Na+-transporting methylmalonyl-CoA/oxaloacetate decarboxylase gamma subunit